MQRDSTEVFYTQLISFKATRLLIRVVINLFARTFLLFGDNKFTEQVYVYPSSSCPTELLTFDTPSAIIYVNHRVSAANVYSTVGHVMQTLASRIIYPCYDDSNSNNNNNNTMIIIIIILFSHIRILRYLCGRYK